MIEERSAATPAAFRDRVRLAQAAAAGMALLVVVFLTGCGSSEYPRLPLHPVTGKVIFNDKPATGAWVVFHPKSGDLALPRARAKVDSQGNYALATYEPQDGAPAGEYVVTVELYPLDQETKEAGPNVIPPKYVSPLTSPIVAHVAEGPNSVPITIKR